MSMAPCKPAPSGFPPLLPESKFGCASPQQPLVRAMRSCDMHAVVVWLAVSNSIQLSANFPALCVCCPARLQVVVLAGSIEAAAGDHNTARALFLRAYQLNKADKKLYMYWPKMEADTGNVERARLLFQYGLSLYPSNTKILNRYACFEEEQGNLDLARELHRRALGIDSTSLTAMHNRVSWASLELLEGNVDEARELLREGLDAHPDFQAAMLLLAKLERQQGNLDLAEAYARRVQKVRRRRTYS
eukprot:GHUV01052466.1.p1 GENE.GHUV01052466.1~~GHUV01052466.1.p1  ORF type:complete len:265 (-),score=24.03 GHUV01052466.1:223-960(-)